jgi:N-acetylglucosaminyl-diphospho-decaprenol L-rhamnosyltransferase
MTTPRVSVTIVAHNSEQSIGACLKSLRTAVSDGIAEVLVVDNASPDRSATIAKSAMPEAVVLRSSHNLGFAGGCNLAWSCVRADNWLLLNPDTVVPPGMLITLLDWFDAHPELGAASPELLDANGRRTHAARRFPGIARTLAEMTRAHLFLRPRAREEYYLGTYRRSLGDHLDVDWVPGTALLVRRETVETVGLLSQRFFMYGEDIEWCWRMRRAGFRTGVCGAAAFVHEGSTSAAATWTEQERVTRSCRGAYQAVTAIKGPLYARTLAAMTALACLVENWHPWRTAQHRRRAAAHLAAHRTLLQRWPDATTTLQDVPPGRNRR